MDVYLSLKNYSESMAKEMEGRSLQDALFSALCPIFCNLNVWHPDAYLKMLKSIGVSVDEQKTDS